MLDFSKSSVIDMRSDTASQPTAEMIESLKGVYFGDDLLGEDDATRELTEVLARSFGMDAAMFCASGSMSNQVAIASLASRGTEIIAGYNSHIHELERAGAACNSGVQVRAVGVENGEYDLADLEKNLRVESLQVAETSLVCLEASQDLNAGNVTSLENLKCISDLAKKRGIPVYLDGARILNSAVALGIEPAEICQYVDAVQICLNKSLGAPFGSVLAGSEDFVYRARLERQRLGGGIRHTGWATAPALIALDGYKSRISRDHEKAKYLAESIRSVPHVFVENSSVATNIVRLGIDASLGLAETFADSLSQLGVKAKVVGERSLRFVQHGNITHEDTQFVADAIARIAGAR
ncbi:low-specificity L-threonine aldolase [Brevibacterium paucivorans]|uniref:threonine aldolase family protein n=1 Tax=Brevibacterium paucivorans TaxID=170994 RepID=UPI0031DA4B50